MELSRAASCSPRAERAISGILQRQWAGFQEDPRQKCQGRQDPAGGRWESLGWKDPAGPVGSPGRVEMADVSGTAVFTCGSGRAGVSQRMLVGVSSLA